MINLNGSYNSAVIFSDVREENAIEQVNNLLNLKIYSQNKIRIMPDYHWGAGCTIGTTMNIIDAVTPNLVGVDIGCDMQVAKLSLDESQLDLEKLDLRIRELIPSGFSVRQRPHKYAELIDMGELRCIDSMNMKRVKKSIGTLGGGNHFIELDFDGEFHYLVVHSGSRNIGKQVADYYQNLAIKREDERFRGGRESHIEQLKSEGRYNEIQDFIKTYDDENQKAPNALCPVSGGDLDDYLHDMDLCQQYAEWNRNAMEEVILGAMNWNGDSVIEKFTTIHNYIDIDEMMLRKGAISAKEGELLIIPINMRDGSIIAVGKGNSDWNNSAPHGGGRLMGRKEAKKKLNLCEFEKEMSDVFTTSVSEDTLDEAPMAYKSMDYILRNIENTVDVEAVVKPVYNFKAS